MRDNYDDYDLAPLPGLFDFNWHEETAAIMTKVFRDLLALLNPQQSMFFDELSEMIYNGILPRDYRSPQADVYIRFKPRIGLLLQNKHMEEREQTCHYSPKRV